MTAQIIHVIAVLATYCRPVRPCLKSILCVVWMAFFSLRFFFLQRFCHFAISSEGFSGFRGLYIYFCFCFFVLVQYRCLQLYNFFVYFHILPTYFQKHFIIPQIQIFFNSYISVIVEFSFSILYSVKLILLPKHQLLLLFWNVFFSFFFLVQSP